MFFRKITRWNDGTVIVPVDQTPDQSVRQPMSTQILGKSVMAMKSYWQQQIFAGRAIPPVELASDLLVMEYVRTHNGAIGYVSDIAVVSGVKVVTLK
jgi:hypothetical protein